MKKVISKLSAVRDRVGEAWVATQVRGSALFSALFGAVASVCESALNKLVGFCRSQIYYPIRRKLLMRRATKEAEENLKKHLGPSSEDGASEKADDRVEEAAKSMAAKAPTTLSQDTSPSGDRRPVDIPEELMPDVEEVEDPFLTAEPVGSDVREKQAERINQTYEFEDALKHNPTTREHFDAELEDAAEVVPPPRRSDIKKTDKEVRGAWETNPNTADEIQEAARLPIVDNQIRKVIRHLITSRPTITGPERQADIVREWFEIDMEIGSGHKRGLNRFVDELADQLLRYGSAALIKQRTRSDLLDAYEDPVTGGTRAPVWGYALPDMATMQVFIDGKGRPRKWRQHPHYFSGTDDVKSYRARDVFMARLPVRQSSMYFWTPSLVMPVLYAIEVLRDLHDTIESHTKNIVDIPSYVQVGDKDYLDGQSTPSMLDRVASRIRTASRGMMLVIPWYVNPEKLESEDYTEELIEVAEFWETIVRRGVGGSKLDDGETDSANRSTADTIDEMGMRAAQALVPEIQRAFRWLAMDKLFENGIDKADLTSHEDMVRLEFEDIDLAQQMAREGHIAFLFQNNLITHGEARTRLGHDPDEELSEIYFFDIQQSLEKTDNTDSETQSRVRPNGKPKPKRKNDELLPDTHPANDEGS